ncbi:MAG: hypothetical protein KVP17_004020, partial [Porospora cf. gigantea B]|uniref:uncharacterized protein n=2 Tax=Porospora cf. gigantea B TaxID=2853592 RepID=UPI003571BD5C
SCKIGTGENGESLGYGFVHFESDEAAQKAIERVNGLTLANQVVYVASHVPKSERQGVKEAMFTNIYVKNFPQEWTQSEFDAVFQVFGEITSSAIRADARGRSFGFVNFETNHAAREAVNTLNGRVILEGRLVDPEDNAAALEDNPEAPVLYVARSQSRVERQQYLKEQYQHNKQAEKTRHTGENLYVKNLPEDVDDDKLLDMFSSFGPVTSAKAMTDERGKCRGFGFVCFHSAEDAARAVTDMHGKLAGGKPLYVTIAERRDTRTSRLQNHRMQGPRPPMMFSGQVPPSYMYPQQLGRPMMAAQNYMWRPQQGPGGRMNGQSMVSEHRAPGPVFPQAYPPSASVDVQALVDELQSAPVERHKRVIGEKLYPVVARCEPEAAGKITGMMLEMNKEELLRLMSNETDLRSKIAEARQALKQRNIMP